MGGAHLPDIQFLDKFGVGTRSGPTRLLACHLRFDRGELRFGIELETFTELLEIVRKFLVEIPHAGRQRISQSCLFGSADFSRPPVLVDGQDGDDRDHHEDRDQLHPESFLPIHRVSFPGSIMTVDCQATSGRGSYFRAPVLSPVQTYSSRRQLGLSLKTCWPVQGFLYAFGSSIVRSSCKVS